jgi:ABC-2 type transport system permease protein
MKQLAVYKASAILTILFSCMFLIAEILTVNVYYEFSDRIGDWDRYSFYILLGSFNIMTSLYTYFFEIAHDEFVYKLRYGELDCDFIKPMDAQAFTSIQRVDYPSLFSLPIPLWLLYQGVHGLQLTISLLDVAIYCFTIVIGILLVYLVNQFSVNLSFWFTDTKNLTAMSNQIVQLGSRPIQVYPKLIQWSFSYLVPVILCTNLSVVALQHNFRVSTLLILLVSTTFFFFIVRVQWKLGLKRYSSASS